MRALLLPSGAFALLLCYRVSATTPSPPGKRILEPASGPQRHIPASELSSRGLNRQAQPVDSQVVAQNPKSSSSGGDDDRKGKSKLLNASSDNQLESYLARGPPRTSGIRDSRSADTKTIPRLDRRITTSPQDMRKGSTSTVAASLGRSRISIGADKGKEELFMQLKGPFQATALSRKRKSGDSSKTGLSRTQSNGISSHNNAAVLHHRPSLFSDPVDQSGAKPARQQAIRQQFERVWHHQKLHTNMPATDLANRVFEMRKHGIEPRSSRLVAGKLVEQKGNDDYEEEYLARIRHLGRRFSEEYRSMQQDSFLSKLDHDEQVRLAVEESLKNGEKYLKKQQGKGMTLAVYEKGRKNAEKVGIALREQLKKQNLDFDSVPLEQLDNEARKLKVDGMNPQHVSKMAYRYIQYYRKVDNVKMEAVKRKRRNTVKLEQKRARQARSM